MQLTHSYISCGVSQLFQLSDLYNIERDGKDAKSLGDHTPPALIDYVRKHCSTPIVLFSDNVDKSKAGIDLANYIINNKLGKVTESAKGQSNHGGNIVVWVWVIDREKLREWKMA